MESSDAKKFMGVEVTETKLRKKVVEVEEVEIKEVKSTSTLKLKDFLRSLPVLEPLSKATESSLKPVRIFSHEFLEINTDEENRKFIVKAVCYYDGRRTSHPPSVHAAETWLKRIPECHPHPSRDGRMILAGTDFTALVISHQWPEEQIVFLSEQAKILYTYLLTRFLMQTRNGILSADFKLNKKVPEMPPGYIEHPDPKLRLADFQKTAFALSYRQEHFCLFMQQGTGKTPTVIARICAEARQARLGKIGNPHMYKVLIVCPRQARGNWENEISRFAVVAGKVSVLRGGVHRRIKGVVEAIRDESDCEFGACICSYETVNNTWDAIGLVPWDLVVFDESHYLKNKQALRSKAARKLRDTTGQRMILTGTPIVNHVIDLWAQWETLGDGVSGFQSSEKFRKFYSKLEDDKGKSGLERVIGAKNLPLIQERLARIAFSISKKEAGLNLPDKVYDVCEVTMTKKQMEYYKQVQEQLALEIEADELEAESTGKRLSVEHILTKMLRLAQITSGHVKWDPITNSAGEVIDYKTVEQIDRKNPKVEEVINMIIEDELNDPNSKTIIWATFVPDIEVLIKEFNARNIKHVTYYGAVKDADRELAVKTFNNDPTCKVMIANPLSAAEALNLLGYDWDNPTGPKLETYTGHAVFFSQGWSPVQRSQAEDRAHRRGMRGNLRVTDLVIPGTIDEEIRARVQGKLTSAGEVQDIKELLQRLLKTELESEAEDSEE